MKEKRRKFLVLLLCFSFRKVNYYSGNCVYLELGMFHQKKLKRSSFLFLMLLLFCLHSNIIIGLAQSEDLELEVEQNWDTYGIGGTCIAGSHNLDVEDVDNDGLKEVITGGFSYSLSDETRGSIDAPLRIWNWNGQNLTLEKSENWPGNIRCVSTGDANGDGQVEILTSGGLVSNMSYSSSLRIWSWNGQNLVLRGSYTEISAGSIFISDIDNDDTPEILTVGRAYNTSQLNAQLTIWQWDGDSISLKGNVEWSSGGDIARANSVQAADLDKDGISEIVTAGYVNNLENSSGQLRIWKFDGDKVALMANAEWRMVDAFSLDMAGNVLGNTVVNNIKVADVDGDAIQEIVTGGFTYDGARALAQLRIWNWTNSILNLEASYEWATSDITEIKSISIADVDSDGNKEVVTSGLTCGYDSFAEGALDKSRAEVKIFVWNGNTLSAKLSTNWIAGESVCGWNVGTGDVDNDGAVEIMTVGCMYVDDLCDPDLRIWSLPAESNTLASFPYFPIVVAGTVTTILIILALYFSMRRRD
jgi:hypothetical protein